MNMKKWLLAGTCISMVCAMSACTNSSEDSGNPVNPDVSASSSGSNPLSSGVDAQGSSGSAPGSNSGNSSQGTDNKNPASSSSQKGNSIYSQAFSDTDEPQMGCSEIMYNAPDGSPLEWVEIYIAGGMDMNNMADFGLHLSGAVDFAFPAEPLKKGEYVVVANDIATFKAEYPTFAGRVFQWDMGGTLVNEGDVINVKLSGEGDVSCAFSAEPPWPSLADGKGRSLVFTGGNAAQSVSWCASKTPKGNPGVGGDACVEAVNTVRINEVMPYVVGGNSWLELYNSGDTDVDVTGWTVEVKRRKDNLKITSGVVPAEGYLLLDATKNFDKEFLASDQGGEIYLKGLVEGQESSIWMPAGTATSGVVDLSDGSIAQGPLTAPTPGEANSTLKMGSVYINEIHYHPKDDDMYNFEYMEIVNGSDADINLTNSELGGLGWKIEGINMTFTNMVFPAKSMIMLLPDSMFAYEADIRAGFEIPATVQFAYYKGKLSNRGETIAIKEPYATVPSDDGTSKNFYVWHDATLYSDCWPELKEADGYGFSLQRKDITTMGYEASAWVAAVPTPGK